MHGFSEREEADFAQGCVYGARAWTLLGDGRLRGSFGVEWDDGDNTAACPYQDRDVVKPERSRKFRIAFPPRGQPQTRMPGHEIPGPGAVCGCGFWAYWSAHNAFDGYVVGVIKGTGRTLIGDRGFRCAKARIVGLALADSIYPGNGDARSGLETLIGARYPSAKVYTSPKILFRLHPPTTDYLPPPPPPLPGWEVTAVPGYWTYASSTANGTIGFPAGSGMDWRWTYTSGGTVPGPGNGGSSGGMVSGSSGGGGGGGIP